PLARRLQRTHRAHERLLVEVGDLERIRLLAHEPAHPLELLLEVGLGREVPGHASSEIPSSIIPVIVSVSPSYMGSGRRPLRCRLRLYQTYESSCPRARGDLGTA